MPARSNASASDPSTSGERLYNFCAGPASLPVEVLEEVKEELPVYRDIGASMLEISHRSKPYDRVEESARGRIKHLLGLTDEWNVLFLQGGASMQFHQVPLNFLPSEGTAAYVDTGRWSTKAIKEAKLLGAVQVAASSKSSNFDRIPASDEWELNANASYVHITTNNTIYGTQFSTEPEVSAPLVADASSDFLSRPIDTEKYGLIYAGAQKNVGPAGVTIVLVRDDFLERRNRPLPTMLDYGTHARRRFNTPPVFAIYLVEKVMRWLEAQGGVEAIAERNDRKAALLYDRIDSSDFYQGHARPADRSKMNVTFRLPSEKQEELFCAEAEQAGLLSLAGHRSVGGVRASIYNACPMAAVEALVEFMEMFEQRHG